jgi:hypothetical protein
MAEVTENRKELKKLSDAFEKLPDDSLAKLVTSRWSRLGEQTGNLVESPKALIDAIKVATFKHPDIRVFIGN